MLEDRRPCGEVVNSHVVLCISFYLLLVYIFVSNYVIMCVFRCHVRLMSMSFHPWLLHCLSFKAQTLATCFTNHVHRGLSWLSNRTDFTDFGPCANQFLLLVSFSVLATCSRQSCTVSIIVLHHIIIIVYESLPCEIMNGVLAI